MLIEMEVMLTLSSERDATRYTVSSTYHSLSRTPYLLFPSSLFPNRQEIMVIRMIAIAIALGITQLTIQIQKGIDVAPTRTRNIRLI